MPFSKASKLFQKLKTISLVRDSFWALAVRGVSAVLLYGLNLLLARWAGADAFGGYSLAWAWVMTVGMLLGLGVPAVQLRFVPSYLSTLDFGKLKGLIFWSAKRVVIISGAVSVFAILVLNSQIIDLIIPINGEERLLWTLASLMLPLVPMLKLLEQILRGNRRILASQTPIMVIRPAGVLIVTSFFTQVLLEDLSASRIMTIMLVNSVFVLGVLVFLFYRSLPKDVFISKPIDEKVKWRRVSLPLLLNLSFGLLLSQSDVMMIGFFVGAAPAGIYFAGARTTAISYKLLEAFLTGFAPRIAPLWEAGQVDELQKMITKTFPWVFWPSALIAVTLTWFAGDILAFWGDEFLSMTRGLQILAMANLFDAAAGPASSLLDLTGHQDKSAQIYGFSVGFSIVANVVGIYYFGITGAAVATALTLALRNIWMVIWVKKYLNIKSCIIFSPLGR